MARSTICLHADERVRPTLIGNDPKWAAVEVISAGAATIDIDGVPSVRVGVLVTVDSGVIERNAAQIPMEVSMSLAIIRAAVDMLSDSLEDQFGEAAVDIALAEDIDGPEDHAPTIH